MRTDKINLDVVKDKIYSGSETFTAKDNRTAHGPHTSGQWRSASTKFGFPKSKHIFFKFVTCTDRKHELDFRKVLGFILFRRANIKQ